MHIMVYRPVTAAQMIRPYTGPQWLVEPIGDTSDADDLAAIEAGGYEVIESDILGWGVYTHIIRSGQAHYLAQIETE